MLKFSGPWANMLKKVESCFVQVVIKPLPSGHNVYVNWWSWTFIIILLTRNTTLKLYNNEYLFKMLLVTEKKNFWNQFYAKYFVKFKKVSNVITLKLNKTRDKSFHLSTNVCLLDIHGIASLSRMGRAMCSYQMFYRPSLQSLF